MHTRLQACSSVHVAPVGDALAARLVPSQAIKHRVAPFLLRACGSLGLHAVAALTGSHKHTV